MAVSEWQDLSGSHSPAHTARVPEGYRVTVTEEAGQADARRRTPAFKKIRTLLNALNCRRTKGDEKTRLYNPSAFQKHVCGGCS
jgi:hypothetical protein